MKDHRQGPKVEESKISSLKIAVYGWDPEISMAHQDV